MGVLFTNNAVSLLAADINAGDIDIQVSTASGALFPQPVDSGDWFPITVVNSIGGMEIMHCTVRAGDTLTVIRGREGTAARPFPATSNVDHRLTAAALKETAYKTWIGDDPPANPVHRQLWFESDSGNLFIYFDDGTSAQWVQVNIGLQGDVGTGGGGSGDLETTPIAATGSSVAQPIPDWLAGAPIITLSGDTVSLIPDHLGAWLHVTNNIGVSVYLPETWMPGWSVGVRQVGEGMVNWQAVGNSVLQVPFTRNTHNHILEQYEEVVFRVIANSDGHHAVWSVSGATA